MVGSNRKGVHRYLFTAFVCGEHNLQEPTRHGLLESDRGKEGSEFDGICALTVRHGRCEPSTFLVLDPSKLRRHCIS
jgi:hypothetical protein